jgi:2'-5' RNA ligase
VGTWRLFLAHEVAELAREELWSQLRPYREQFPDCRWTKARSWHLTLLFLGEVDRDELGALKQLADFAAAGADGPFRVTARLGGGRARRGDGVAWLGLAEGAGQVIEIADQLFSACPTGIVSGSAPKRTPAAHLTVARRAQPQAIAALRRQAFGGIGATWAVTGIVLTRSHLGPDGARYETVHRSAL